MFRLLLTAENDGAYHKVTITPDAESTYQDWIYSWHGDIYNIGLFAVLGPEGGEISADVNLEVRVSLDTVTSTELFTVVPI